ncbi:MAG: hypothetical protein FIO02_10575 [Nitrosopumilales archaeon]|nr:hypothetical protein [Nitrosopumilales archaeon]
MERWDWDFIPNSRDTEGLESTIRKCFGCNFIMCHKCNTHRALVDMTIRITAIDAPEIKHRRKTIFVGKV